MDLNDHALPVTTAEVVDARYLAEALQRAGRSGWPAGPVRVESLDGGRTGAGVSRLHCADGATFVLKVIPRARAFREALGHEGEAAAWLAGATRSPPPPLANPALDAALHRERDEWWLLMDDVSAGIVSRTGWTEEHTRDLFAAVAGLHAAHWDCAEAALPALANMAGTTTLLTEIALHAGTGGASAAWAERAAGEFEVPRILLPDFLEIAGTTNAEFYIALLQRSSELVRALNARIPTFVHGDLRRANVSFLDRRVVLLDWELAARGPAAVDLAWHWFLHYWAYPPADGRSTDDRLWLREAYLESLEQELGRPVDRDDFMVAWDLGWLRVFTQLGFVLVDGIDEHEPGRRRQVIRQAFDCARRIADERLT